MAEHTGNTSRRSFIGGLGAAAAAALTPRKSEPAAGPGPLRMIGGARRRNVIFILSDDHRFDFMGFTGKVPWLSTPHLDSLAAQGAHFENAFVTTSLCSPSRASILTGLFSHLDGATIRVVLRSAPTGGLAARSC